MSSEIGNGKAALIMVGAFFIGGPIIAAAVGQKPPLVQVKPIAIDNASRIISTPVRSILPPPRFDYQEQAVAATHSARCTYLFNQIGRLQQQSDLTDSAELKNMYASSKIFYQGMLERECVQ